MSLKNKVSDLLVEIEKDGMFEEGDPVVSYQFFESDVSEEVVDWFSAKGVNVSHIDNFGGEGEGDQYWSVYKFTEGDETIYVKFNGWYASYNGAEFTEWFFVEPKEKMITVYE
jgi:hypothetical protein